MYLIVCVKCMCILFVCWHLRSVYKHIYSSGLDIGLFVFCLRLYLCSVEHWDLFILSRFLSAKVSGVSSYGKLIPELASSHMVSITFGADLAGSESDLYSRTPRPGPG